MVTFPLMNIKLELKHYKFITLNILEEIKLRILNLLSKEKKRESKNEKEQIMSDEYHQSGSKGSLVDPSVTEAVESGNYPPQFGDSTSSGGFASTTPHPDTRPDAKELNISGAGSGRDIGSEKDNDSELGLVGSGEPEGVDKRGEDAVGALPGEFMI